MQFIKALSLVPLVAGLVAAPLLAQDAPGSGADPAGAESAKAFTLSGSATLVNSYFFRGISLSNSQWAIQGGMQLDHKSGLFVGTWASSIATVGATQQCTGFGPGPIICNQVGGANAEVDVFGGWSGTLGPLDVTAGMIGYLYPGASGLDYFEFYGTAGYTLGTVSLKLGLNWAPSQNALTGSDRYLFGSASWAIPGAPLTLRAQVGSERGSLVIDNTGQTTGKMDWLFALDISGSVVGLDPLSVSFGYVGNNLPDKSGANSYADGGFLFTIGASF